MSDPNPLLSLSENGNHHFGLASVGFNANPLDVAISTGHIAESLEVSSCAPIIEFGINRLCLLSRLGYISATAREIDTLESALSTKGTPSISSKSRRALREYLDLLRNDLKGFTARAETTRGYRKDPPDHTLIATNKIGFELRSSLEQAIIIATQAGRDVVTSGDLYIGLARANKSSPTIKLIKRLTVRSAQQVIQNISTYDDEAHADIHECEGSGDGHNCYFLSDRLSASFSKAWLESGQGSRPITSLLLFKHLLSDPQSGIYKALNLTPMSLADISRRYLELCRKSQTARVQSSRAIAPADEDETTEGTKSPSFSSHPLFPALADVGTDLIALATIGELRPVIGRDGELRRLIRVLTSTQCSSALLTGESGVGKTSIVEGLAQLMAENHVPRSLLETEIFSLHASSLIGGTTYRGELETRYIKLLNELSQSPVKVILFIDEIHSIIQDSSFFGFIQALKPYLSSGKVRIIGACTDDEFSKYQNRARALFRRFELIRVERPTSELTREILKSSLPRIEGHHGVSFTPEAVEATVRLALRHLRDSSPPDSVLVLADRVAGIVREFLDENQENRAIGPAVDRAISRLSDKARELWGRGDVKQSLEIRLLTLPRLMALSEQVGEPDLETLKPNQITEADVRFGLAIIKGSKNPEFFRDRSSALSNLETHLNSRVVGQPLAVQLVANRVRTGMSVVASDERPKSIFLFVGPTGVGKTELAKALSSKLDCKLFRFDMSEYQEKHSVARLIGAPPGYVGYDEGGQLTEAVRKHPNSIVLLDEIEKAHPDISNLLLQLSDEGVVTDGRGVRVDFRDSIIILTSNVGTTAMRYRLSGFGGPPSKESSSTALMSHVVSQWSPEFYNRIDEVVVFKELTTTELENILQIYIDNTVEKLRTKYRNARVTLLPNAISEILRRLDTSFGARDLRRIFEVTVLVGIAKLDLDSKIRDDSKLFVDYELDKFTIKLRKPGGGKKAKTTPERVIANHHT